MGRGWPVAADGHLEVASRPGLVLCRATRKSKPMTTVNRPDCHRSAILDRIARRVADAEIGYAPRRFRWNRRTRLARWPARLLAGPLRLAFGRGKVQCPPAVSLRDRRHRHSLLSIECARWKRLPPAADPRVGPGHRWNYRKPPQLLTEQGYDVIGPSLPRLRLLGPPTAPDRTRQSRFDVAQTDGRRPGLSPFRRAGRRLGIGSHARARSRACGRGECHPSQPDASHSSRRAFAPSCSNGSSE